MSLIDDFEKEAPREEIKITHRGHKIVIKTILGLEAAPYYKYIKEQKPEEEILLADYHAATIAASIFLPDGTRPLPPKVIPSIRDHWSQQEINKLLNLCREVGNTIGDDEQEKKE